MTNKNQTNLSQANEAVIAAAKAGESTEAFSNAVVALIELKQKMVESGELSRNQLHATADIEALNIHDAAHYKQMTRYMESHAAQSGRHYETMERQTARFFEKRTHDYYMKQVKNDSKDDKPVTLVSALLTDGYSIKSVAHITKESEETVLAWAECALQDTIDHSVGFAADNQFMVEMTYAIAMHKCLAEANEAYTSCDKARDHIMITQYPGKPKEGGGIGLPRHLWYAKK